MNAAKDKAEKKDLPAKKPAHNEIAGKKMDSAPDGMSPAPVSDKSKTDPNAQKADLELKKVSKGVHEHSSKKPTSHDKPAPMKKPSAPGKPGATSAHQQAIDAIGKGPMGPKSPMPPMPMGPASDSMIAAKERAAEASQFK